MWYKSLHRQRKLFLLIIAAPLLCVTLSGCSLPGSFFNGNDTADIDEAIRITQEQYGIKLTLQKKLIPGGAACNVKVRCEELPGVDISIFRFDENSSVISDYIFQKYGEEAYDAICAVVGDALPGSRENSIIRGACCHTNGSLQDYIDHPDDPKEIIIFEK